MKKTLIAILALAALAACNKTEVVDLKAPQAIAFESPFVDNSTKAIDNTYSATNLPESFKVYGTLTNSSSQTVNIFNGVDVIKTLPTDAVADNYISGTSTWYYADDYVQYWMAGNKYNFAAVVGATLDTNDLENGMPKTIVYTVSTQADLLYAKSEEISYTTESETNVAFKFDHLLSKVVFTFENGYTSDMGFYVKVDDVSIVNAAKSGKYTIGETASWSSTEDDNLAFGPAKATAVASATEGDYIEPGKTAQSNTVRLLIPESQVWQISFKANVYIKSGENYVLINTFDCSQAATNDAAATYLTAGTTESPLTLSAGYSYNFKIKVSNEVKPITFSATASDWTDGTATELSLQ